MLGYTRPADGGPRYTISREKHVQVDGKFADAVLGDFGRGPDKFIVALEGKGPKDPLDRPFAGRRMSAVDQGYRYAINLPCDWIIVTSIRQTRLYGKGTDQQTYERFDTEQLADDDALLKRFVFLLGAARVVPETGRCHFYDLLAESERVGKRLDQRVLRPLRRHAARRLRAALPRQPRRAAARRAELCTKSCLTACCSAPSAKIGACCPTETIRKAYEHRDPYHPRPIWDNFRGLFQAINQGNAALGIHAYNGGLFADDPVLDDLKVADEVCAYFRDLGDFDYRPAHQAAAYAPTAGNSSLIDVDILGHIFEQSITDLERLRNELDGLAEPASAEKHKSRRKKEGAFYTPAVHHPLHHRTGARRGSARPFRATPRSRIRRRPRATARAALADPRVYELDKLKKPRAGRPGAISGRRGKTNWRPSGCLTRLAAAARF